MIYSNFQDLDKVSAQQKSQREAEQERQWKQLQARQREQQQQQQQIILQDPNQANQGQVHNDPNQRGQFVPPGQQVRQVGMPGPHQVPAGNFSHPGMVRQNSMPQQQQQQQRQMVQQRPMNQSPFSPQNQPGTPQSPHDLFPEGPVQQGIDQFQRPLSNEGQENYMHNSPQGRPMGHQSPGQAVTPNRSPVYSMQNQQQQQQAPGQSALRLNLDPGYAHAPGTPRPGYSSNTVRPTVYARPENMFGPPQGNTSPFTSPRSDPFQSPQPQEGNRQLRDLLQRQQSVPQIPNQSGQQSPSTPQNVPNSPIFDDPNHQQQQQQQMQVAQNQQQVNTQGDNTFRQPLPPGMIQRPTRMPSQVMSGGKIIRNQLIQGGQIVQGPRGSVLMSPDLRQKLIRQGGNVIASQVIIQNQAGQQIIVGGQRMPHAMQQQIVQQQSTGGSDQNVLLSQRLQRPVVVQQQVGPGQQMNQQHAPAGQVLSQPGQQTGNQATGPGDNQEIPDIVTAEIEKLEQEQVGDEALPGEDVGDILGKLGEDDDDDLLTSLTAEMGDEFNLLEYADPELDTHESGEKTNLFEGLELDEHLNAEMAEKEKEL